MSTAAGGPVKGLLNPNQVIILGAVGGLAGIYLTMLNQTMDTTVFSFLGGIGAIFAAVWGADAVRRVCSYGLGTGVPSIGMLALGMGIVASMFGLTLPEVAGIPVFAGPIIAFIVAAIIGLVIGVMSNKILKMNIPIMEKSMVEIAGAGALVMIGLSAAIAGSFNIIDLMPAVVETGFIALVFIGGAMAILHPFNGCLGPDEKQDRTLMVAVEKGALIMAVAGFASLAVESMDGISGALTTIVGLVIWVVYFKKFMKLTHRDAHLITGTGLLPTAEELE
ncbi:MAG: tetrahydromethanopterin S-methyltransferase subunit C [Methanosarcinales archaeon]|nr:tetrahydromethanopterin S-methyltransferase subunit C [ANME-2 cluster archaeon]MDF1532689.1 tetrahydromethanopterin S-methyltransferase subunit C [ANME-2 cluster archaeon]MDW7774791.1 tetrahydromethanopterin S-methyltransferase subunit C [Methanosarcinales archaeon]